MTRPRLDRPHVAVIGAGPAGSVAAIRLTQLGHRVTLFEKAIFPRDKVCGECLSATGIAVLGRLGVADAMHGVLGPTRLRRATAVATDGTSTTVDLPAVMWGLTRRAMDQALASHARAAGVTVIVATASWSARGMSVPVISGDDRDAHATAETHAPHVVAGVGGERRRPVDLIIVADGRGSSLSRVEPTGDFGIKAHFRGVDAARDAIELVALADGRGYAGLAPVNDGLWNAAWSVPAALLKAHRGDVDALFQEQVGRSPRLRRCFASATRVGEWLSCPLPRHAVRRDWPANVIPIGNAAAALEPVGGEGMGLAMRSGELAAEAIDAAARAGRSVDAVALRRMFDRLWQTRRAACRGGAMALSHPLWGPLTVGLARRSPCLARIGMALVGK